MSGFGAQAYAMYQANMSYYTDPAGVSKGRSLRTVAPFSLHTQYMLTNSQPAVISAVLEKTADVGFITTVFLDSKCASKGRVLIFPLPSRESQLWSNLNFWIPA
jgi:hypothetical protein